MVRDEVSKNILSVLNKRDLLLFIMRLFSAHDSDGLLQTEIQHLKIARPVESIKFIFEDQPLMEGLLLFKTEKVGVTSCPFCPSSAE